MAATITLSNLAPQEEIRFSLAHDSFELAPGGSYETNDPELIGNAHVHPWLDVEGGYEAPEDENAQPVEAESVVPLAVDAALKQETVKTVGRGEGKIAHTIAADRKLNDDEDNN